MPDGLTTNGGEDRLAVALAGIGAGLKDLSDPASDAGKLLAADASRRAPRASGRLRSSITAVREQGGVTVGTPIAYGTPVHQGVPAHNMAPRPFLADALRAAQDEIVRTYATGIDKLIAAEVT